ncbi:hypothetical protein AK51_16115 [Serratia nematodiphila DZ0503SBS1]|nr:hypothetical protein AK51_16115 [Serratia nematodiphila DZ0503SBS1]
MDAVIYAAAKIRSGLSELILAGGVESMSRAPYVLSKGETPFDKGVKLYDTTLGGALSTRGWRSATAAIRWASRRKT